MSFLGRTIKMRCTTVSCLLFLLSTFLLPCAALQALLNSPCALQCGNVLGSTSGADLVCKDSDYGTATGTVFKNCITCQLLSTYVDPVTKQTDLQWAIYNLRYAISWCLFGFPNNPSVPGTPCTTSFACGSMQNGFEFDSLSPNSSTYRFCPDLPDVNVPKCKSCLAQQPDAFFLTNFVTALNGACLQQPIPGNTVSLQGSLFSNTLTNVTTPSSTPISTNHQPTGGLSLGAKVGIAVAAILLFLATLGFCIVWRGRRRRRRALAKHQQESGYSTWLAEQQAINRGPTPVTRAGNESAGGFFDSPQSQKPLWPPSHWGAPVREDESPASAMGEKAYFSPYSSHYSSPVSAHDQPPTVGKDWPLDQKASLGGSVSGLSRSRSTEKKALDVDGDRIEMQNVAPVLLHPGNGRGGYNGLTEADMRAGQAL